MSRAPGSSMAPRRLGTSIVTVAFLGAVIGGVGAPLITAVALDLDVPLDASIRAGRRAGDTGFSRGRPTSFHTRNMGSCRPTAHIDDGRV